MPRILVLTTAYPPYHYGGYELLCQDVVTGWQANGHNVTVLTGNLGASDSVLGESRREVRRDLNVFLSAGKLTYAPLANRRRIEQANQSALQAALSEVKPEVVSVWHMLGMSSGLLTTLARMQVPMVCVVGDEWPRYVVGTDQWMRIWRRWPPLWRAVERVSAVPTGIPDLGEAASFCFASEYLLRRCQASSPWTFPRSSVIHHGIDIRSFPVTRRDTTGWSWRLATAGRLDPAKGFATAISSLQFLPAEAHLDVLSSTDDPYRLELEALATRLGVSDRVTFGVRTRSELRLDYLNADVFVFPSEWPEPFGLVPIEAMACGTPVVATGTGGSAEFLVHEVSCLRFEPGNPRSLAASVRRLAASADLRAQLATTGRELAQELTVDRLTQALEQWHVAAAHGYSVELPAHQQLKALRPS